MAWSPEVNLSRLPWQSASIFLCFKATKSSCTLMCRSIWTNIKWWWELEMDNWWWDVKLTSTLPLSIVLRTLICCFSLLLANALWDTNQHLNKSDVRCCNTWKSARILSIPQSGVFKLPSPFSESESLEFWRRCFMKAVFLFLVPKPDFSSASILDGVRLGFSNSLLGLTSLSSSLSDMAAEFLRCKSKRC